MIGAVNDRDFAVRSLALAALGVLRYERAIQALTEQFQHFQTGTEAALALGALAQVAHPSSAPVFTSAKAKGAIAGD